jgi:O-antigen ligase
VLRTLARRDGGLVATPADAPLILFIGLAIAAFIFGTAYALTPETTRQYFKLLNSLIFFFTIGQILRQPGDARLVVRALIIGGACAAVFGIVLYHLPEAQSTSILRSLRPLGYPTGEVLRYVEDNGVRTTTLRAIGTSIDPNVFGGLLLVTGTLTLSQLASAPRRLRPLFGLGLALILYALLLSLSRGSWIGFLVGFFILAIGRSPRLLWVIPAGAVPAAVLFWNQLSRFADHFLKAVYAQDQATGMRLGEYKDALTLISQNPWLGVGFGGTPSSDLYLGVSSTYLMVAEEMGLLGLAAYLLVIAVVVGTAVRRYRRLPDERQPVALGLLAAFVGVLVAAIFDKHYFELRYQNISALYWMLAALVLLSLQPECADNPP